MTAEERALNKQGACTFCRVGKSKCTDHPGLLKEFERESGTEIAEVAVEVLEDLRIAVDRLRTSLNWRSRDLERAHLLAMGQSIGIKTSDIRKAWRAAIAKNFLPEDVSGMFESEGEEFDEPEESQGEETAEEKGVEDATMGED